MSWRPSELYGDVAGVAREHLDGVALQVRQVCLLLGAGSGEVAEVQDGVGAHPLRRLGDRPGHAAGALQVIEHHEPHHVRILFQRVRAVVRQVFLVTVRGHLVVEGLLGLAQRVDAVHCLGEQGLEGTGELPTREERPIQFGVRSDSHPAVGQRRQAIAGREKHRDQRRGHGRPAHPALQPAVGPQLGPDLRSHRGQRPAAIFDVDVAEDFEHRDQVHRTETDTAVVPDHRGGDLVDFCLTGFGVGEQVTGNVDGRRIERAIGLEERQVQVVRLDLESDRLAEHRRTGLAKATEQSRVDLDGIAADPQIDLGAEAVQTDIGELRGRRDDDRAESGAERGEDEAHQEQHPNGGTCGYACDGLIQSDPPSLALNRRHCPALAARRAARATASSSSSCCARSGVGAVPPSRAGRKVRSSPVSGG